MIIALMKLIIFLLPQEITRIANSRKLDGKSLRIRQLPGKICLRQMS